MPAGPIVVIDASATQSLLYRLRLEERGLEVIDVDSLEAALSHLRRTVPAAVVVNLRTVAVGVDADSVVAALRGERPDLGALPVVLLGDGNGGAAAGGVLRITGAEPEAVVASVCRIVQDPAAGDAAPAGPAAAPPGERPATGTVLRRGRVLVVDDSVTYREFLRLELEDEGCQVTVAGGPRDAYDALETGDFDVVVVDLVMPGVTGTELCEAFDRFRRERRRLFDILVHTSQDRAELLVSCLTDGADEFVGKSQPMEVLKARLLSLLRRKFFVKDCFLA